MNFQAVPEKALTTYNTFITKGWVQMAAGTKGGKTLQWGDNSHENMPPSLQATVSLTRIMRMAAD